jgi:pimeloyl-ACP methyl ester carboxylesterase
MSGPGSARPRKRKDLGKMERRSDTVDGTLVSWLEAPGGDPPVLYVHGVPDSAELWTPFLERTGGIAIDLPGFGRSGKSAGWPYSLAGYAAFLPAFLDHLGIDRVRLVVHDWGAVALTLSARIERLVAIDALPLLPRHRWPWIARVWRTPVLGELAMGFTGRTLLRRVGRLSADHADQVLRHFDHGTQRAILKLYRSARENVAPLHEVTAPALVVWGERDPYLGPEWAGRIAAALGGETEIVTVAGAGHWPWLDRPEILQNVLSHTELSAN